MERRCLAVIACLLAIGPIGCGGNGGGSTPASRAGDSDLPKGSIGMAAPIDGYVVARRVGPVRIQAGPHILAARPCVEGGREGLSVINLLPETAAPDCLRVGRDQRILVVNRTGAFGPSGRSVVTFRLADYEARIAPQEAALFPAPVGRYLALGLHAPKVTGAPGADVLVVRTRCIFHGPEPRAARLHRRPISWCF
jgi:hypothetical protein